ncbi:hypothetical protein [Cetobacterium somerae]|uniref:hypothetical protein n=1 Tax=Cetobacterium somerae TaxID=188913 RepID=UPI00248F0ADA|nr:hypothetical protein [Cetobacterium somerae]
MKNIIKIIFFTLASLALYAEDITIVQKMKTDIQKILRSGTAGDAIQPTATKTIMMGITTNIVVPLEIISDIDIEAMVIDDQDVLVPFELEMSKTPNKKDYFKVKYSETEIDIDKDGKVDTYIYSNKYINSKIQKDNYVLIRGRNISKEGYHEKIVYIDVEIKD